MPGRVYTDERFVSGADVDPDGVAHLHAVADWLQAIAFADGLDAGLGVESAWIIRRTSLRIARLPAFGETLTLRTWCGGIAASVAERRTAIAGDAGASVEAEAIWVHIDPVARRPARFSPEFLAAYSESAGESRPRTKLRHPASPPADASRESWRFTRSDLDLAGHVNNAAYWRIAEELLPRASLTEIEYRGGVGAGAVELAVSPDRRLIWVVGESGEVAATLAAPEG